MFYYVLCARHCSKYFTLIVLFYKLLILFCELESKGIKS